jgi:methylase of polypeptide subunit release factors
MSEREQQPSILELGSGTGLVGLAAAAIWKCHVTLTDLPEIVPNLEGNARRNEDVLKARGGSVNIQELDWSKQYSGKKRYDVRLFLQNFENNSF